MRGARKLRDDNVLAIRKHHNLHNAVLCEDRFAKTDALYAHLTYRRTRSSFLLYDYTYCSIERWPFD